MERDDLAQKKALLGRVLRDRWTLDALLGAGGMATVYAATHRNGSRGAIKILHAEYAAVPEIRTRLVREGYLVNRIKHRGVVRVIDDDVTEEGWPYLVMELLEGRTLKERWIASDRKLPLGEALRIAEAVLDVLAAAHEERVVHRDVKPDNVFLTDDGDVRLLDFGIARFKEAAMDATQTGAMLGTPAFMAPEQALAHWDDVDARSDVFAVGATLWTVLTNRLIHPSKTVPEALIAAATRRARPFTSVVPSAPPELAAIVDRALAFAREDRWQSAAEMRDAIARLRKQVSATTAEEALAARPEEDSIAPRAAPRTSTEIMTPVHAASDRPPEDDTLERVSLGTAPTRRDPAQAIVAPGRTETTPRSSVARRAGIGVAIALGIAGAVYVGTRLSAWQGNPTATTTSTPSANGQPPAATSEAPSSTAVPAPSSEPTTAPDPTATATTSAHVSERPRATATTNAAPPPFDSAAADAKIRAATRRGEVVCPGMGRGSVSVILRFTPDGSSTTRLADPVLLRDALGRCALQTMSGIVVAPFTGPPQERATTITVP